VTTTEEEVAASDTTRGGGRVRSPGRRPLSWWAVVREALVSALTQPVASVLTLVVIAGMCAAVLLTAGRAVGAEQDVIGSIDSAGTRSIIVRAEPVAGLDTTVLDRIRNIDGIEWAGAFSLAHDVRNGAFDDGTRVPLRQVWADDWAQLGLPKTLPGTGDVAYASDSALAQLGLDEPVGPVELNGGSGGYAVGGRIAVPEHLAFLEPLLLAPQPADTPPAPVGALLVIAERPDLVAPVAEAVGSVLGVDDPTKVSVQTSEDLASLRAIIEGQLGSFGRTLTLGILAVTAFLVAVLLYGMVMLRRKDFGRRRALGASQRLIVALITIQTAAVATVGAAIGSATALIVLAVTGDPLPGWNYVSGVGILAVLVAIVSALLPAVAASRREPIRELRVP